MKPVYYNDNDTYCVEWLRNLIAAGHLPKGTVDRRDIREVRSDELKGYEQAHFFAGIGGWPYALKLAGWDGPVWTASIPCQPLSSAGRRKGHADERHLWPEFRRLIATCRPTIIFGEQVASSLGRSWLARVRMDLENIGYWAAYQENLHEVLGAKTTGSLSAILGKIAGRIEADMPRLSEGLRSGVAGKEQRRAVRQRRAGRAHKEAIYRQKYDAVNRGTMLAKEAGRRAKRLNLAYDLDQHFRKIETRVQRGRCELTGLPFNFHSRFIAWNSPSLHRIDPAKGYTYRNIQVVCFGMNAALGNWGEVVLRQMLDGWLRKGP